MTPIEHRVCPNCARVFFAAKEAKSLSCPHCGYVLLERRRLERREAAMDMIVTLGDVKMAAHIENYSDGGIRMSYGGSPISKETVLGVDVEGLKIHGNALAVWTRKVSGSTYASGLRLI